MYAIIETGGKQYKVAEGDVIFIEKLDAEADETVTFDKVLAIGGEDELTLGAPYVDGASVGGTLVKNGKAKKIIVFKYKPKKGYRKKQGHRQPYTKVTIDGIFGAGSGKPAKKGKTAPAEDVETVEAETVAATVEE